ncbi:alpha-2-macroglobulin family protein [Formosa sp. Hel1_33_131]|uniref:alpha-2-macroglobulin family protein n=1 Tax=Formosa sp. Hel1_33_131 TaxID=1336794 RepID=UPI00084E25B0|nr:alpha-2-macroglobulin [Formosa sp. Hel1_33_131]AOR27498.1 alpha-2-macroglobulin family protein [Formosa sp. Hel1_33_131]
MKKIGEFLKSKPSKITGISIGILILIIGVNFILKSCGSNEKKINFTVSVPAAPNLEKQENVPPLYIKFNGSVSKIEDVQKEIATGLLIQPKIKGIWSWSADNEISFHPVEQWAPGTEYEIEMDRELFSKHIKLETYNAVFETSPFTLWIASSQFHIDVLDENIKQVIATVNFSHPIDPNEFESRVSLKPYKLDTEIQTFKNKDYKFSITYDDFYSTAYVLSEPLPIPEDDVQMELTIEKGTKSSWKGNRKLSEVSTKVIIPGMLNFVRIESIQQTIVKNKEYESEQFLVIDTKGKIRASDLLKNAELLVLPMDLPALPGQERIENHHWYDVKKIGPEVRKLSISVQLTAMESEHEFENINSFKMNVPPLRYVYLKIKKGTPFYGKYFLSKDYEVIFRVRPFQEELEIMHDGIILSSTGEKKISIMSQGIKHVRFQIGRVLPDQINHLITQSNGNLTNLNFRNWLFSEDNIVENHIEYKNLETLDPGESNFFSFDFTKYLKKGTTGKSRNGVFFFKAMSEKTYTNQEGSVTDKRLIIVSDLGILVKESANQHRDLFIQSIKTGLPVANAKVQVLGKNGIPILSSYSDTSGHVAFPSLDSFKDEKQPTAFVVTKGEDLSFLPVEASGRWLNYSKFDIGGVYGSSDPAKLNAYLFSERGIYRPGDEFNIAMITKSGDWRSNLEGAPVEASIIDPRGLEIYKKRFKLNNSGFEEIKYITENSSPTGTYQINLYTVKNKRRYRSIGSTTVSVEEFLPDRLSISTVFPGIGDKAWVSPEWIKGQVSLRNLFGSPASGNKVSSRITFSPGRMRFPKFRNYRFYDPLSSRVSYSENLPEQLTDADGKAVFDLKLDRFDASTYNLTFIADGFEKEGGRSVTSVSNVLVSPLEYLIGTKTNGDLSYIYKDSERAVQVIAVNSSLKKTTVSDLQFIVNRIDQISVLTKKPNGIYAYKSVSKKIPLSDVQKNLPTSGLNFNLPTSEPGKYELIIKNKEGVQFSHLNFSVVGMGNLSRSLDKTAELEIKLNKTDFDSGEEIEIYVKAPYKGAGIITIEKDKVYASKWFVSETNSFLTKIKIPKELEGNGYINVSFVRAADSKNIYITPLSYGIAPFEISKKKRINPITLDIPSKAKSGEVFRIKYKTEKPTKIVVFAVDEGILQVAKYKTPDPLAHFFKKNALEVKTSQLLDLILPEYSLSQRVSAMGGGSGFDDIGKNLNPFKRKQHKPVVYWSGIVSSDQNERSLEYTVPDYFNGTLRVMAVAVSANAIGTAEEKAIVKNPFVISPNVPVFATPGDAFQVTVTVTNTVSESGENLPINLAVLASPHLKVEPANMNLKISQNQDTTVTFKVHVNKLLGAASLTFKATSKKSETKLASYLSVRPAISYQTTVKTGTVRNEKIEVETPRKMYEDYRILNTSVSFLPQGLSKGLIQYLDKFPYGCTEQIVSQGFPYLLLKDATGFEIDEDELLNKISYTLKILQARQNGEGKFGIWAANSHTSDFITVYAAHFITQCKQSGYNVSDNLYNRTLEALRRIAKRSDLSSAHEFRVQAYAIYILTLNEIITTNYITSLRNKLEVKFEDWKQDLTAGYIAGAYFLMQQEKQGKRLLNKVVKANFKKQNHSWNFYDNLMHNAQLLYLLASHQTDALENVSESIIQEMVKDLESGNYNTLNSSYSIMALNAFSKATKEPAVGNISIYEISGNEQEKVLLLPTGKFPVNKFSDKTEKLVFDVEEDRTAYYQVIQAGYELEAPKTSASNSIEVSRTFTDLKGNIIQKAALGEEIEVHLKFRSLNDKRLSDIAFVDLLPAGLEVSSTLVRNNNSGTWTPDYVDVREDRVIFYGNVNPNIQEFVYKVRAINKGTFITPPFYGESMYDLSIFGYAPNENFVVE